MSPRNIYRNDAADFAAYYDPDVENVVFIYDVEGYRLTGDYDHDELEADESSPWLDKDEATKLVGALSATFNLAPAPTTVRAEAGPDPEQVSWDEAVLLLAQRYERKIVFTYSPATYRAQPSQRTLRDFTVSEAANGHKLVVGYDVDRDEPRAFRLDRMRDVGVID